MDRDARTNNDSGAAPEVASLTFYLLVTPPLETVAFNTFSITTCEVPASFSPADMTPPHRTVFDSLDRHMDARWGDILPSPEPVSEQEFEETRKRLTNSVSQGVCEVGPLEEAILNREVHSFCGLPRRISDWQTIRWLEFHWTDTGEFLLPHLGEARAPTFSLIHTDGDGLAAERFASGPVRLIAEWDEHTQEFSRISALLAQECIEEAIDHFVYCLRRSPDISAASCIFYHFESSLIDYLMASDALDATTSHDEARALLREDLRYAIVSLSVTPQFHHTLRVRVTQQGAYGGDLVPTALSAEIVIPVNCPLDLESIDVRWNVNKYR